jgi:hypothetical protein
MVRLTVRREFVPCARLIYFKVFPLSEPDPHQEPTFQSISDCTQLSRDSASFVGHLRRPRTITRSLRSDVPSYFFFGTCGPLAKRTGSRNLPLSEGTGSTTLASHEALGQVSFFQGP